MASKQNLKKLQPGIYYKEHPSRKRDSINKDRLWVIVQRLGGVRRTSTLGWEKSDKISCGDALNKALEYKTNHKWNLQNPLESPKPICKDDEIKAIEIAVSEAPDNPTVAVISERFLKYHAEKKLKPKTAREYRRQIGKYINPKIGNRKVTEIKKHHIVKLVEDISDSAPIMANRVLATIKGMFTYAVKVDVLPVSPASGIDPPGREVEKERILELNEIATLFNILGTYNNRDTSDIIRLITLTALRPGEVAKMNLSQIKKENTDTWLELKKVDTKNKQIHRTFLNNFATQIINDRIADLNLTNYIFPAKTKSGYMRTDVLVRRVSNIQPMMKELDIDPFTPHDLRRSAATGIAKIGHWAIVGDILGHTPQGVTRKHYDLYGREPEIKNALEAWGNAIENAINPQKKTPPKNDKDEVFYINLTPPKG